MDFLPDSARFFQIHGFFWKFREFPADSVKFFGIRSVSGSYDSFYFISNNLHSNWRKIKMIAAHRRRNDKIDRERVLLTDNAADFPKGSPVDIISEEINAKVTEALAHDAALISSLGDKSQALEIKGDWRDHLLDLYRQVVAGAVAIGDTAVPGITAKFKMPHPRTEQNLIAHADSTYADTAPPLEEKFVLVGLDADFRDQIISTKTTFQQSRDDADSAVEQHGEAVGALEALFREMMALSRQRSAMVKLKYKNNPGKLAAWAIASHLEQPPKKKVG